MTTFSAEGEAEAVPDMDQETLAHYRRFEAAWAVREGVKKGWNKTEGATEGEDDDGEEREDGGVKLEEGEDEAMVDSFGLPEPVSGDEHDDDSEF